MILSKRKQKGVTLLETMLVLAIGALIIVSGIRWNTQRKNELEVTELKQTVNVLFNAMNLYWRTNCDGTYTDTPTPTVTTGALNGKVIIIFNIAADLASFLPEDWADLANNRLVNATEEGTDDGFIATIYNQSSFSALRTPTRKFCTSVDMGKCVGFGEITPVTDNNVNTPIMQIAVKVRETNLARLQTLANRLDANCLSSPQAIATPNAAIIGNKPRVVGSCAAFRPAPATTERFIVFEKTITPSPVATTYWPSIHQLTTFKNMYTHDIFYEYQTQTNQPYQCGI